MDGSLTKDTVHTFTRYGQATLPELPDTFAIDQTELDRIMSLPEDDFRSWADSLTVANVREVSTWAASVRDEHRRRAEQASILIDRVREITHSAADYDPHGDNVAVAPRPARS